MNEDLLMMQPGESADDYLWRLGTMKEHGIIDLSWDELAIVMNAATSGMRNSMQESGWRKRYTKMKVEAEMNRFKASPFTDDAVGPLDNWMEDDKSGTDEENMLTPREYALEKLRMRIRDERSSLRRMVRKEARTDNLMDLFETAIKKYEPLSDETIDRIDAKPDNDTAVYALLSDVHYGITFSSIGGEYNSAIARQRILKYAHEIVSIADTNGAQTCYVTLLGDMISGLIHSAIRVENKENIIEQVVGVSELVSEFLHVLSENFSDVYVNSVSGNHSRLDLNADDALRGEKLDALIPWYCKAKLADVANVTFMDDGPDTTIVAKTIKGKTYVAVHGDMDKNLSVSAANIERKLGTHVDYILCGHLHVPEFRFEHTGFIRNGAVCGSGDEYTVKKRLFSPPYQVCMLVTDRGVEAIYPVML